MLLYYLISPFTLEVGNDTLIESILMLLSNFKADTSLSSSYQMVVKSFRGGDTIPQWGRSSHRLCCSGHWLASQVKVTTGQYPCEIFTGQTFSLGLLAALGIMWYQISMVADLEVSLQWSALFTGRLLRMLLPCVLGAVRHSLLFFHPGWSVRQEGWGVEGEMGWAAVLGMTWSGTDTPKYLCLEDVAYTSALGSNLIHRNWCWLLCYLYWDIHDISLEINSLLPPVWKCLSS